jgi:acetyl esterase/lipase
MRIELLSAALFSAALAVAAPAQETVTYDTVGGTELTLDVYQPADHSDTPRPGIVLIHGGGWTSLDKSTMRGMGNFLARMGFVAFSIDYRLFDGKNNPWPAQLDDAQHAVRWVRANAAKYGVNPDKIGAFGHSAGAQLAALLGMEDTRGTKYSSKVEAAVVVSGPSDFTTERDTENVGFLTKFLGANRSVWRDASPAFHGAKSDAPILVVHGVNDPAVPIAQAQELVDTLQSDGATVSFVKLDGGHTFEDDPANRRRLAIETLTFFKTYLGTP